MDLQLYSETEKWIDILDSKRCGMALMPYMEKIVSSLKLNRTGRITRMLNPNWGPHRTRCKEADHQWWIHEQQPQNRGSWDQDYIKQWIQTDQKKKMGCFFSYTRPWWKKDLAWQTDRIHVNNKIKSNSNDEWRICQFCFTICQLPRSVNRLD